MWSFGKSEHPAFPEAKLKTILHFLDFTDTSIAVANSSCFSFDVLSPNWNNLPAYLAKNKYKNPTDVLDAAFHTAHNTKDHFISFLATKPDFQRSFQTYMSGFDEGRTSWMDFYPVERELAAGARQEQDAIMFVDIGGGMGHEAVALKKRFPHLPGRYVVQDLPQIVEGQKLELGVESLAHDFFTPQPLKGICGDQPPTSLKIQISRLMEVFRCSCLLPTLHPPRLE